MHNRALTADNMLKKNWPCDPIYPLCFCLPESMEHLLTGCDFAEAVWKLIAPDHIFLSYSAMATSGGPTQWAYLLLSSGCKKEKRVKLGLFLSFGGNYGKRGIDRSLKVSSFHPSELPLCSESKPWHYRWLEIMSSPDSEFEGTFCSALSLCCFLLIRPVCCLLAHPGSKLSNVSRSLLSAVVARTWVLCVDSRSLFVLVVASVLSLVFLLWPCVHSFCCCRFYVSFFVCCLGHWRRGVTLGFSLRKLPAGSFFVARCCLLFLCFISFALGMSGLMFVTLGLYAYFW
jgi:hypothetical protein